MALFSERSTTRLRLALVLIGLVALGGPLLLMAYQRTPLGTDRTVPVQQPVEFDHRHHVKDDGIDCLYCHYEAERSPYAGVPAASLCMGCHGQIWNDSPLLEPVRRSFFDGVPIRWNRVYDLPDFVYFDHSAHLAKGVGCTSCHGAVESMGRVYRVEPLTMGWCLDCHRAPAMHLRPLDRITDDDWSPPEEAQATTVRVNPPEHCSGCHR